MTALVLAIRSSWYLLRVHAFEAILTFVWFTILPIARLTDVIRHNQGPEFTYEISIYQYYYLGAVGLAKFGLAVGVGFAGATIWDPYFAAFLGGLTYILLSGGIHLDGFTDTFDALFAYGKDRWEVLKDPHIGALGAAYLNIYLCTFFAVFSYNLHWVLNQGTWLPFLILAHASVLPKVNCYAILDSYVDTGQVKLDQHLHLTPKYYFWENSALTKPLKFYTIVLAAVVIECIAAGFDRNLLTYLLLAFAFIGWFNARVIPRVCNALGFLAGDVFGWMICLTGLGLQLLFTVLLVRAH